MKLVPMQKVGLVINRLGQPNLMYTLNLKYKIILIKTKTPKSKNNLFMLEYASLET